MAGVWQCLLATLALMCVCLWGVSEAVGGAASRPRPKRPTRKPKEPPTEVTTPAQDVDIDQVDLKTVYKPFSRIF